MVARCVFWLLVLCLLACLFLFSRKRFHQVILVGALSIVSGVVLRLFSLKTSDQGELVGEAYFLIAIGVVYGVVWLGSRYLDQRPRPNPRRPP